MAQPEGSLTSRRPVEPAKTGRASGSSAPRRNATSGAPERPPTRLRAIPGGNDESRCLRVEFEVRRADGARADELRERQLRAVLHLLLRAAALQADVRKAA